MKKLHHVNLVCVISIALTGCDSSGSGEISKFQAAPLLSECIAQSISYVYNNENHNFDTAEINLGKPPAKDVTFIAKSIRMVLSEKTESITAYKDVLAEKPKVGVVKVSLVSNDRENMSCDFVYFSDKDSKITQLPLIYKINTSKQEYYINAEKMISPISPIEYLFDLFKNQNGVTLYSLKFATLDKSASINNQEILNKIGSIVSGNSLLDFYELEQSVSPESAISIANQATANLNHPNFVPQNPIYIVPSQKARTLGNLDNSDEVNVNAEQMDSFNNERYVDATTGIQNHRNIIQNMRAELGLGDASLSTADKHAGSSSLSINTNNYTKAQMQESSRMMQRRQEEKNASLHQ